VIGFIIALSGVDPATAGDVNAIGPMVSALIGGMSVALYRSGGSERRNRAQTSARYAAAAVGPTGRRRAARRARP
jgi:hypothetical protein